MCPFVLMKDERAFLLQEYSFGMMNDDAHSTHMEEIMSLPKRYDSGTAEPELQASWQTLGTYHFSTTANSPIYAIDTPPATVSGRLHLGHANSYSQADFIARFWRMNGYNVFYPMGFDDNGLPTDRYIEKRLGITAQQVGRRAFIAKCLEVSEEDRKSTRLNSSHQIISYAVFCLKKKKKTNKHKLNSQNR